MNCSITDKERIEKGLCCRSFSCEPCRDFSKANPTMKTCKRCTNFIAYDGKDFCGECSGGREKIEKLDYENLCIAKDDSIELVNKINEIIEHINGGSNE